MLGDRQLALVLQALVVLVAGCGNDDVVVPDACLEGPPAIRQALERAPGEVRLAGEVQISGCFKQAAEPADVQDLGASMLAAAQELAAEVRAEPRSQAAVELGYLVGAIRRSSRTDAGVHYEAERRIEQELVGVPTDTPEFRRGLDAGLESG